MALLVGRVVIVTSTQHLLLLSLLLDVADALPAKCNPPEEVVDKLVLIHVRGEHTEPACYSGAFVDLSPQPTRGSIRLHWADSGSQVVDCVTCPYRNMTNINVSNLTESNLRIEVEKSQCLCNSITTNISLTCSMSMYPNAWKLHETINMERGFVERITVYAYYMRFGKEELNTVVPIPLTLTDMVAHASFIVQTADLNDAEIVVGCLFNFIKKNKAMDCKGCDIYTEIFKDASYAEKQATEPLQTWIILTIVFSILGFLLLSLFIWCWIGRDEVWGD
ncbi:hypothetical protein HELRODRAFT_172424 [Helobdella robusta]|uniref:ZP domain-containing protein n=1 Tax=Helobdella robusta TaxID=6412 RepID=T1F5B1_HELRO|nr:hypothetical protein HELRODRAFT_172424 [Helobdella robusta]ESO04751.1 hypothetical protein HELRODRAFT_172424 [Helobdella robusta]